MTELATEIWLYPHVRADFFEQLAHYLPPSVGLAVVGTVEFLEQFFRRDPAVEEIFVEIIVDLPRLHFFPFRHIYN